MKTILVTHVAPDLDGLLGLWILIRFGGYSDSKLAFVPVGKRLDEVPSAIHVDTGLGEFDHHQSELYTCSARLVYESVLSETPDAAVAEMVDYALLTDWYRQPEVTNGPFTVNSMIEGLNQRHPDDPHYVATRTFEIFDALYESLSVRLQAEREYLRGMTFESTFGHAFAIESSLHHVREIAHRKGANVFVFVDPVEGYRGYKARSQKGIDFTDLARRIRALEPEADWFLHSSKELLLCGSAKAPDRRLSRLPLEKLVELIQHGPVPNDKSGSASFSNPRTDDESVVSTERPGG